MRVTSLKMSGFRSFVSMPRIEFGAMNVLIGANNSGKSSILRALHMMQEGAGPPFADVRSETGAVLIEVGLSQISGPPAQQAGFPGVFDGTLFIEFNSGDRRSGGQGLRFTDAVGNNHAVGRIPAVEPFHFIVPYLSKRKTAGYGEDVRLANALQVMPNLTNLAAKLVRICNPSYPRHEQYMSACQEIVGFAVTALPSDTGLRPGVYLPSGEMLPIDQMGEGIPNIVGLLTELATSDGKLFLIEEPENDLHPDALKALLRMMVDSSKRNQFFVSTHSNIVLQFLGSATESHVFVIEAEKGKLPVTATVNQVAATPEARLAVLRSLGYAATDFDLWDGWLILEESSAERLIRDYLIPWFAPRLSRVRTIAAGGTSKVEPLFEDFGRIVLFAHLEPLYRGASWVRVDGDASGREVIGKLKMRFRDWASDRFAAFSREWFEDYYPAEFAEQVRAAKLITDRQARREEKKKLLIAVIAWLDQDVARGKAALEASAREVIDDLILIEKQILSR